MSELVQFEQQVVAPAPVVEGPERPERPERSWLVPVIAFVVVGVVLWSAALLSANHLPHEPGDPKGSTYGSNVIVDTWVHWDGSWYDAIARDGYSYTPGQQSSVAFWPSYPLVLRAVGVVFPHILLVGVFVTLLSGFAAVLLFHRWCRLKLSPAAANTAVVLLVVYPYAWYLFGPVYADALCLAAALAAFLALERDHLWLAGMAGIVASAARPVGVIVALALVIRLIEMRRASGRPLCRRDAPVLLAFAGVGAYCAYLWATWGNPLLFAAVQSAPGWEQGEGPRTWFKLWLWDDLVNHPGSSSAWGRVAQGAVAIAVIFLLPRIVRRLGWAYAFFTFGAVMLPIVGTKDFQGTGRYLLVLFPAFAVLGELLAQRPRLRAVVIPVSALVLVALTAQFARGVYLA